MSQTSPPMHKNSIPLNPVRAILDNLTLVIAIAVGGVLSILLLALLTHAPYYTVSTSLIFQPKIPELVYSNDDRSIHSFKDWVRTQTHEIESNDVLRKAILAYEDSGYTWINENETEKTAIDRLRGRLDITQINNTQIITLDLGSYQKVGLAELVNEVGNQYISAKDYQRKAQDRKKLDYLRQEMLKYSTRLEAAYDKLMSISRNYGTAVADEKNMYIYLDMYIDLRTRYNQILTRRIESENKLTALQNQKERLLDMNLYDLDNTQLTLKMEQEISSRMVGLNQESKLYDDYSALLNEIDISNISIARKYLISEIDKEINEQTMIKEAARTTEKDLQQELKKSQYELMEINSAVLKTSTQRQEIERIISIWDRLNNRIEEIEIELFNPGRVRVLSAAMPPTFPDPSKLLKKMLLGFIMAVGFALGLAVLKEFLDKRIKRLADIEQMLGFPASGYLLEREIENIREDQLEAVYRHHPNSYMAELYNQITVSFEKEQLEHGSQTFAFFSLKGKSGVSSAAKNILSMIDADKHEKILVNLNSKPVLDENLEAVAPPSGLIDWLIVHKKLELGVVGSIDSHFDELHLGSLREMSIARIRPSAVRELMSRLKERYKYVFIDGPPLLVSSEAQTVAQQVDVSTLIIDSQRDIWPELTRATKLLDKLRIGVLAVILNKVQVTRGGYFNGSLSAHYLNRQIKSDNLIPEELGSADG